MAKLTYSFVGERRIASVDYDATVTVEEIREAIVHKERLDCPASRLAVYLTKPTSDATWLKTTDDDLQRLMHPHVPDSLANVYLRPTLELWIGATVNKYFPDGLQSIPQGSIHLLVDPRQPQAATHLGVTSAGSSTISIRRCADPHDLNPTPLKRPTVSELESWTREPQLCPQLVVDDASPLVRIPAQYLVDSGLSQDHDLVLYRRAALQDQLQMIQYNAMDSRAVHWICGAPGAGKSAATFAFACGKVDRTLWTIVWVHYDEDTECFRGVKFQGDVKSTCCLEIDPFDMRQIVVSRMLDTLVLSPKDDDEELHSEGRDRTVVFFDGFDREHAMCDRVCAAMRRWKSEDSERRRLVVTSSTVSLGKQGCYSHEPLPQPVPKLSTANAPGTMSTIMSFCLVSWTLDDYVEAVRDDTFFASVKHALCSSTSDSDVPYEQRVVLVTQKYYLAGGNAQFMFCDSLYTVRMRLKYAVRAVEHGDPLLKGFLSKASPHQALHAYYYCPGSFGNKHHIVSSLAARLLAVRMKPRHVAGHWHEFGANPLLNEFCYSGLDAWVLSSIQHTGLDYVAAELGHGKRGHWPQQNVEFFTPPEQGLRVKGDWHVPTTWTEGGYDAVFVEVGDDQSQSVSFIHVARGRTMTLGFTAEPFVSILDRLDACGVAVDAVELVFVVPLAELESYRPPVSHATFDEQVVQAVFPTADVDVTCRVRVVGVEKTSQKS